jgi:epsilon-lactone hydrolase
MAVILGDAPLNLSQETDSMMDWLFGLLVFVLVAMIGGFGLLVISASRLKISVPAQIIRVILPFVPTPNAATDSALRQYVQKSRARGAALPNAAFREKFRVEQSQVNGAMVWTIAPRATTDNPLRILYLHGSAYISQAVSLHWDIVEQVIDRTGAAVMLPFYPLAPEHDHQPAYALVDKLYTQLSNDVGAEHLVIAGDSAGGGIALSYALQLRESARALPAALVLFSPWLDVTMSDPIQHEIARRDALLSMSTLQLSGRWWAGDRETTDPIISPLYGTFAGLPPTAIFIGTDDLLYPDSTRFAERAKAAGVPVSLHVYPHMFHVWMGFKMLPEAAQALDQAAAIIRDSQ